MTNRGRTLGLKIKPRKRYVCSHCKAGFSSVLALDRDGRCPNCKGKIVQRPLLGRAHKRVKKDRP
jgi:DNA-directed RNA polymerase subunit RPC12/RpoP